VRYERIGASVPNPNRLVDEVISLRRLLGDGVDGVLKDLALTAGHGEMVDGANVTLRCPERDSNPPA